MVTKLPPVGTGDQVYRAFMDGNPDEVKDPNLRCAMVLLQMGEAQSQLLTTIGSYAQELGEEVKDCNEDLQLLATAIKNAQNVSDSTGAVEIFVTSNWSEREAKLQELKDQGVDPGTLRTGDNTTITPHKHTIYMEKRELAGAQTNITLQVENINADVQRLQITLQKLLQQMTNSRDSTSKVIDANQRSASGVISRMGR